MSEHPLQTPWTFYVYERASDVSKESYTDCIQKIGQCRTCEEFWAFFSHIKKPTDLLSENSPAIHLFRFDYRAAWEDPANIKGGLFRFLIHKKNVDLAWEKFCVAMVAEQVSEDVLGAVCMIRNRYDALQVWIRFDDQEKRMTILNRIIQILQLPLKYRVDYTPCRIMSEGSQWKSIQYVVTEGGATLYQ